MSACACDPKCSNEAVHSEDSPYMDDFCDDCTSYRHDIEPHPAGSSVPEAARAAKWGAIFYSPVIDAKAWHYDNQGAAFISKLIEEIDAEVAAAVAEERATTGRRIEALAESWDRMGRIQFGEGAMIHGISAASALRAALASPGEES